MARMRIEAEAPGLVHAIEVGVGDVVECGDALLVVECMKMHIPVAAPAPGTVTDLAVAAGDQIDQGSLLAVLETG